MPKHEMAGIVAKAKQSHEPRNFMYALMKAIEHDQITMSQQQFTDAKSTQLAADFERELYDYWKNILAKDAGNVEKVAEKLADGGLTPEEAQKLHDRLVKLQQIYSEHQSEAQSNESQTDALTQSTQQADESDAKNLAAKAQMMQAANSILGVMVNMLGSIIAA